MEIKNIDPIIKKSCELLEELNEKTLIPMKHNLDIQWDKLQNGEKIENYDISKAKYEKFKAIYLTCKEVINDYISLLESFNIIKNKLDQNNIKESMEKGRLLPSKIMVLKSVIDIIYDFEDYYERK